jgi:uncharacterized sulfatase
VFDFVEANSDKPFFLWWAPDLPHFPFNAPDKYYDMYKDLDMSESAKRYYANVTWFDDAWGEVMDYFDEKGLMENTLFVYVNDNGWDQAPGVEYRNDSLQWHNGGPKGKGSYYDQTFRTPLIFSWKGNAPANQVKNELVSSLDILPTILDYTGVEKPGYLPGMSLRDNIDGKVGEGYEMLMGNIDQLYDYADSTFYMGKPAKGYWLRTPEYHFAWDITHGNELLFDMKTDPENDHNIANDHPELIAGFKARLKTWQAEMTANPKAGELDLVNASE